MRKFRNILIISLVLTLWISALMSQRGYCSSFPRNVRDFTDNNILIKSPPHRIITIGPSASEVAFSLVNEKRIIAVSSSSNYPPEASKKEKIGDIYLNYEKIVALEPDLVIVESTLNYRAIYRLRELHIPVLAIKSDTYQNFSRSMILVGLAVGNEKKARRLLKKLKRNMNYIADKVKDIPREKRPGVFIEIWNSPLMTAGSGTFIHYVIENAGGVNIAADMNGYPQLNAETLLVRNPDIIILTTSSRKEFMAVRHWKNIKAAKTGRIYEINPDILVRPTLRLYQGCRMLYNLFYPEMRISSER